MFAIAVVLLTGLPLDLPTGLQYGGFAQALYGEQLDDGNPATLDQAAMEARFQLRAESFSDNGEFFGRLDFVVDEREKTEFEWELREAYYRFRIGRSFDFKVGRQILTWGTGDSIFINDVFAKDYRSYFVGRNDQYLKAPQDAIRAEWYLPIGGLTAAWSPFFEPNRLPTGDRLSYYSPFAGEPGQGGAIVGDPFVAERPARTAENGEIAVRFSRQIGGFNTSLYGYRGFYKNPIGFRPGADFPGGPDFGAPVFPELQVYGASVRGAAFGFLVWAEGGYYDSLEDPDGDDFFLPNSTASGFVGIERMFASVLTVNAQWQATHTFDHETYRDQYVAAGYRPQDELHHLLTSRIHARLLSDVLTLSSFLFYSPSDEDLYARFLVSYAYTDELDVSVGANLFHGKHEQSGLGQFQKNDNAYLKLTYGF